MENAEFRLAKVLENVVSLMGHKAEKKGLSLHIDSSAEITAQSFIGDSLRLDQILLNLIGNAVKFTEHGEIAVSVRQVEETAESVLLRFEVQETGIGITVRCV